MKVRQAPWACGGHVGCARRKTGALLLSSPRGLAFCSVSRGPGDRSSLSLSSASPTQSYRAPPSVPLPGHRFASRTTPARGKPSRKGHRRPISSAEGARPSTCGSAWPSSPFWRGEGAQGAREVGMRRPPRTPPEGPRFDAAWSWPRSARSWSSQGCRRRGVR